MNRTAPPPNLGMTESGARAVAAQVPPAESRLAIVGANVIDPRFPDAAPNKTVLVRDGRIVDVADAGQVDVPPEATVLDATGMFLTPGLWDMHVHQFDPSYLELHLRNGVTGLRHMSGVPDHLQWRQAIADGASMGPRTILASPIVDGPTPLRPGSIAVHDAAEARQAVRDSHAAGAEFIKIYNLVPHDAFEAIERECAARRIPFVGHLPLSVGLAEASAAGQASVEHLEGLLVATSSRRDELQQRMQKLEVRSLADMGAVQQLIQQAAASHDPKLAQDLYGHLAHNGTWLTPTLAVLEAATLTGTSSFPLTDYLPHVEPYLRPIWEGANAASRTHEEVEDARQMFDYQLELVGQLHRAGIPLLAGTDTFVPGFSLHDELRLFVEAGLSPRDALRAATMHPAIFLGIDDSFGTIEPGKVADLLLLRESPLENIANTRSLDTIILAGTTYQPMSGSVGRLTV